MSLASAPGRRRAALLSVLLVLAGCASVKLGQHVTAKDYARSPQRIFIVSRLDTTFERTLPDSFAGAIVPLLARCGVAATVYRPDQMELDAEAKAKSALDQFKPDAVLGMQQTRRFLMDGETRSGSYLVTLTDLAEKRQVWRAALGMGASTRLLADRSGLGASFADEIVRAMAGDNVLKSCPAFPPKPES